MPATVPGERDLRLDLFRGIGLWLIFLDHIPFNVVSWITLRNYGFSDAAEMFVFISGYTAGFVYGPAMREGRSLTATGRLLKRAWQLYVTHVLLVVIFIAEISYVGAKFDNPLFAEEFNVFGFLRHPDVILTQALILKFRPPGMDVLPLFIVLVLACPAMLWALLRRPGLTLLGSALLWLLARKFDWNFPSFPGGQWFFNPFAWQLMFVIGAWCALDGAEKLGRLLRSPLTLAAAVAYVVFAFLIVMTWHVPQWAHFVPKWLTQVMYPIDKSNLHVLRLVHFLALAAAAAAGVAAAHPVRAAFAGALLLRRIPVVRRPFHPGGDLQPDRRSVPGQRGRDRAHGRSGVGHELVQDDRGSRSRLRPRGGRPRRRRKCDVMSERAV